MVTVEVSPIFSAVSATVMLAVGRVLSADGFAKSMIKSLLVAPVTAPAFPVVKAASPKLT